MSLTVHTYKLVSSIRELSFVTDWKTKADLASALGKHLFENNIIKKVDPEKGIMSQLWNSNTCLQETGGCWFEVECEEMPLGL